MRSNARQALRPCLGVRGEVKCDELTRDGRCASCAKRVDAINKDKPWRWVYVHPLWRRAKRTVRREQPWCAVPGCNNPTTDVDHVVPVREVLDAGGDPFDRSNLQGLCKKHHSEKTAREVWGRK